MLRIYFTDTTKRAATVVLKWGTLGQTFSTVEHWVVSFIQAVTWVTPVEVARRLSSLLPCSFCSRVEAASAESPVWSDVRCKGIPSVLIC